MKRFFLSSLTLAAVALLSVTTGARGEDKPRQKPDAKPEPANVIILKIDGDKLPPDLLKKLIELQGSKQPAPVVKPVPEKPVPPVVKPVPEKPNTVGIGLVEAIAIAQKVSGGVAVKAEKKGESGFAIELMNKTGEKVKVNLDGSGKILESKEEPKKEEPKKEAPKPESVKPGQNPKQEQKPGTQQQQQGKPGQNQKQDGQQQKKN